jgi:hypothetical protein
MPTLSDHKTDGKKIRQHDLRRPAPEAAEHGMTVRGTPAVTAGMPARVASAMLRIGMKRARILITSLAVVHVVLHFFVIGDVLPRLFPIAISGVSAPRIGFFWKAMYWVGPSQGTLFALWVALGSKRTVARVLVAVAGIVVYLSCFHDLAQDWLLDTIGQAAVLTSILLLARLTGLGLDHTSNSPVAPRPLQVSTWDVLVWTTVFAVVLIAIRFLSPASPPPSEDIAPDSAMAVPITAPPLYPAALAITLVTIPSIWLGLGKKWLAARVLLLPMMICLSAAVLSVAFGYWKFYLSRTIALTGISVWLLASLSVVRLAGYSLTWQWRFRRHGMPQLEAVGAEVGVECSASTAAVHHR